MTQYRRKGYFAISIICVLIYTFLFSTAIVFADEPTPPATTEETTDPPVDEIPHDPTPEIEEAEADEQVEGSDAVTTSPADSPGEGLSEGEDGILPEQAPSNGDPIESPNQALDTDSEVVTTSDLVENEEEPTLTENLDQLPADTKIVVIVDDHIEPLATQEAAEAIANIDPVWCPDTANPGGTGCTSSYATMSLLLSNEGAYINSQTESGTIWITAGIVGDIATITIDGSTTYTTWANYGLTLQGGWDGVTDQSGNITGNPSIFSVPIRILNWNNTVSVNDISITNPTTNGLTVTTTGDINLDNVTSSNNSNGNGASLSNNSAGSSGNINVTGASNFSGNSRNGLAATSNGTITLQTVTANNNSFNGASLNNNAGSGHIVLSGTNNFNGNTLNGLRAVSAGNVTSTGSLSANYNGGYGVFLNNTFGSGYVSLDGTNTFNNNYYSGLSVRSDGNISLANATANNNSNTGNTTPGTGYGVYLNNLTGSGAVAISGVNSFNSNYSTGLGSYSNGAVTASNLTATDNGNTGNSNSNFGRGVFIRGGDVTLSGANIFNSNYSNGLHMTASGNVELNNITAGQDAATGNGGYGAFINNRNGAGYVSITGSNVFNGNTLDGLRVLSNGNITTGTITTGQDAATGNGGYGAFLNNSTGSGDIALSGVSIFNGNTLDGLRAVAAGNITSTNNLTANDNIRHGVFLDNRTGTGVIAFTGVSTFSGNTLDGLRVLSAGNITSITSLTANDNRFGVYLDNTYGTGYVKLTGTNTFSGNRRDGLYVETNGDITVKNTTASTNGQNGFNVETTNGTTALWCGKGDNNGLYGVNATQNKELYLFGMTFTGNTLGDVNVDGGSVYYGHCDGKLYKRPCSDKEESISAQKPGIKVVSVTGAQEQVGLDCRAYGGTKLILPNGDFALIPCPIGEAASLISLPDQSGAVHALPAGSTFGSGVSLEITAGGQSTTSVDGLITVSFMIPKDELDANLAILFWNGSEWVEVDNPRKKGARFEAKVDYTGIFVLVSK